MVWPKMVCDKVVCVKGETSKFLCFEKKLSPFVILFHPVA